MVLVRVCGGGGGARPLPPAPTISAAHLGAARRVPVVDVEEDAPPRRIEGVARAPETPQQAAVVDGAVVLAARVHLDGVDAPRRKRRRVDGFVVQRPLVAPACLRVRRRVDAAGAGPDQEDRNQSRISYRVATHPNFRPLAWT